MMHGISNLVLMLRARLGASGRSVRSGQLAAGGTVLLAVSLAAYVPALPAPEGPAPAAEVGATRLSEVRLSEVRLSKVRLAEARPGVGGGESGVSVAVAKAEAALVALAPHVARTSSDSALGTAFRAYFNYRAAKPAEVTKPYLYFVDLGLDNATARGWVFDMEALRVVEGAFNVAHGRGSGPRNGTPNRFSNAPGSNASSLGLYLAQETYTFTGKSGGRRYASVGLRLRGESGEWNGAARARGVVAHGAPYVTSREAGRSEGCPALEPARAKRLLPLISEGGVVFIYSPNETRWLAGDPWLEPAFVPGAGRV